MMELNADAETVIDDPSRSALPGDLVRALDWLRAHLAEPIDLDTLAFVAGVRPRTLEEHFRTFLKTTPLGWMRKIRLARARLELEHGRTQQTVTEVAVASGFSQLGRFAGAYRAAFGETPSATLRRRRRPSGPPDAIDDEALRLTWQALPHVFAVAPRECGEALEALDNAQRLAPSYGLPAALAAWCWGQRAAHGFTGTPQQDREHGIKLAARTRALAPNDALALTLASGALTLAHQLEQADHLLDRALALDPSLPFARVRRGWSSVYMGDAEAAFDELRVAMYLAPFGPVRHIAFIGMGCAHFALGHYDRAVRWVQSGTEAYPGGFWADRVAVAAAVHTGARGEASSMARRLMRRDPNLTVERARKAWPFPLAFMGRLSDGLQIAGVPKS